MMKNKMAFMPAQFRQNEMPAKRLPELRLISAGLVAGFARKGSHQR
ncbi:MAG: hypothetical protein HYT73_02060 [Candidatus Aenigmarchaeota archaeon]|nr:hypothetical protein [Candidatus Aenigmarchaeota archaeon]